MRGLVIITFALSSVACVSSELPPGPLGQTKVTYGNKVFVASAGGVGPCAFVGTSSHAPGVITFFGGMANGGFQDTSLRAHNCYIPTSGGDLMVDTVPVSNDSFQVCVDSEVCEQPNPIDQTPEDFCTDPDNFGNCPIVSVTHFEAKKYCEFVGRRLPSALEHLIFRTGGQTTAASVPEFPREGGEPGGCDEAVLDGCGGAPSPMFLDDTEAPKGAAQDDVLGGVYDLTGNVTEWARDLFPSSVSALPVSLCTEDIAGGNGDGNAAMSMRSCPDGKKCLYGSIELDDGSYVDNWPVCVISDTGEVTGGRNVISFGSSFNHVSASGHTRFTIGPFRIDTQQALATTDAADTGSKHKALGFRCVGNPGDDVNGVPSVVRL